MSLRGLVLIRESTLKEIGKAERKKIVQTPKHLKYEYKLETR